jgi:hypothetical protein
VLSRKKDIGNEKARSLAVHDDYLGAAYRDPSQSRCHSARKIFAMYGTL